ncbi:hypothetical protein BCE75_11274 [Isoptericola sp. CG 20/1183]|uniref:Uncharacterized protein n=1 Tax=Isoptericola halotolerans TaxID=300560 RepID=A0ABX5ED72_9MICO|nr:MULTISPECIES: hypothetical protein [Isoptericola]PRZ03855.1 hypothetical protein BCE75_11274 [Isoptericola sp. CG 20/1183]PRZ04012.1 hypothetical protein BCL65_11146 [Isoptericola halotolerans]
MIAPRPSPDEAAASLERATPRPLSRTRDHWVHGWTVAALALAVGALTGVVLGTWGTTWQWRGAANIGAQGAFLALLVTTVVWRDRASRTRPRRALRTAMFGTVTTGVLALGVATPVYLAGLPSPAPWVTLGLAAVVATPGLVAGAMIVRGAR